MRQVICVFLSVALSFFGIPGIAVHAETPRIIQVAGGYHSLALFSDGSLYAWGENSYGQLGDGTTINRSAPTLIGTGYTAIALGIYHCIALKGSTLYAWGYNKDGQLGDGTNTNRSSPTLIGTGFTEISAGGAHSFALKGSTLYAWGYNREGQLGDGTTVNRITPTLIGSGYTAIAANGAHSLALKGNALYAWGDNGYGQVGDSTVADRSTPTLIGTGFTVIAAGDHHSLALKGNVLYAWGNNEDGQLGDGTNTNRNTPFPIGTGYTVIKAGGCYSLALKGRALYAWGRNGYGQLGDGTSRYRNAPILIGTGYTTIAAGEEHSLAAKGNVLYTWGNNSNGRLGDGTTTGRTAPTRIEFPVIVTIDPLYTYRFSVKNSNLSVGDKAVFTAETGKNVSQVRLYDQDGKLVAKTNTYKSKDSKRIWTFSLFMAVPGQFRYWVVASNSSGAGKSSADVIVNVSTASLETKGFTINSPALDVGETVTFTVITGKLANKVSILDASDATYASSSKPSKITSSQKIWTIRRKLTESDMGSFVLHARIDCAYGSGPDSETLEFRVTDNLPRIISISPVNTAVRRGTELIFTVVTNAAATCVWISNDKNEKWQQTAIASSSTNRLTWRVTTTPTQLGSRKFYAQAYRGAYPGLKVLVRKVLVIK